MEKINGLILYLFLFLGIGVLSQVLAWLKKKYLGEHEDGLLDGMFRLSIFGIVLVLLKCLFEIVTME